ncbi:MAG TPA: leucine zipper domain-containing protein, partial [Acidimicrobiales bacterium]
MKIHGNARLLPSQRALLCERVRLQGWTVADAAEAFGVSERTAYRWLARWDAGKPMTDLSSAPHTIANRTDDTIEALIEQLRRCRWTSTRIATELRMPTSTVCAVLKRIGLN